MKTVFKVTKELDIILGGCGHVAERHRRGESRGIQLWKEGCVDKRGIEPIVRSLSMLTKWKTQSVLGKSAGALNVFSFK